MACAMLGRLLYSPSYDGIEVLLFFKGVGGSGKSSLLKLLETFFDDNDIAILSNRTEEVFGMESFVDKKVIFATDLTKDANFDTGNVLNIVSGDTVSVGRKFKTALKTKLDTHFVSAGNAFPLKWVDIDGNFYRRFFLMDFPNAPRVVDALFKTRLKASGGLAYRFINVAFLKMYHFQSTKNFWANLPKGFWRIVSCSWPARVVCWPTLWSRKTTR